MRHISAFAILFLSVAATWAQALPQTGDRLDPSQTGTVDSGRLEFLSFDELVELSRTAQPTGELGEHLKSVLNTVFVHNDPDAEPAHRPTVKGLGPVVRLATWNVERGLNYDQIRLALSSPDEFRAEALASGTLSSEQKSLVDSQLTSLRDADILVLNEVDLGMKRTDYRDVARDLAAALHMNYAYGVEFVEVDPIFELGTENIELADADSTARLRDDLGVDPDRYRGLHGTAILSRYPIQKARIVRLPVCYDWYAKEAAAISKLENGRRWSADRLFKERINRELRHGGRMALIAQVAIPDLPTGAATVVAVHLENKCQPSCRRKQVESLLAAVKEDENPLIMAGDFNTSGRDNTPTSVRYEIMSRVKDYKFWINQVATHFNPLGIAQYAALPVKYFHGYRDPTAFHLPIFWENSERGLFAAIEKHRFADGRSFDFRGDRDRSTGERQRTLANSNERGDKGFVPTYVFDRNYGGLVGQFKLDWIFVKPFITHPRREGQSFLFAPHFATTMRALNDSVTGRISDHPPLTVDLPLQEPLPASEESPAVDIAAN